MLFCHRRVLALAVVVFIGGTCSSVAQTCAWSGAVGDGKWSTPGNWDHKPVEGDTVEIKTDCTIDLDEDAQGASLSIDGANVTFIGEGRFSGRLVVSATGKMVIDGPTFHNKGGSFNVQKGGAVLELLCGRLIDEHTESANSVIWVGTGSKLIVRGGMAKFSRLDRSEDSEVVLEGGTLAYDADTGAWNGASHGLTWTGGTLIQPQKKDWRTDAGFMPAFAGQTLICRYATPGEESVNWFSSATGGEVYDWGGDVYVTNDLSANVSVYCGPQALTVRGRGKVFAPILYANKNAAQSAHVITSDWSEVGVSLKISGSNTSNGFYLRGTKFSACGNWSVEPSRKELLYLQGDSVFDTTDRFDGETPREVSLYWTVPQERSGFSVMGLGELMLHPYTDNGSMSARLAKIAIGDGSTFSWVNDTDAAAVCWKTRNFVMGENAVMNMTAGTNVLQATDARFGSGATLNVTVPTDLPGNTCPLLVAGGADDLSALAVNLSGATAGWTLKRKAGSIYLSKDGQEQPAATQPYEWTGAVNGNWNDAQNWSGDIPKKYNCSVYFNGDRCTAVTNNVGNINLNRLDFLSGAGPFVVSGGSISLRAQNVRSSASAIRHGGAFPLVFTCLMKGDTGLTYDIYDYGTSFTEFRAGLQVPGKMSVSAEAHLGGSSSCNELQLSRGSSGTSVLQILSGGRLDVAAQNTDFDSGAVIEVGKDAVLNVASGLWRCASSSFKSVVEGLMELNVPVCGTKGQGFYGSGCVKVKEVVADAGGSSAITLGEGIRFCPDKFATETSASAGKSVGLFVESKATLGANCDWTYGPETTPLSAEGGRTLRVGVYGELTFDTQDAETGVGHAITLNERIDAEGAVTKKGSGTLVFCQPGSSFRNGLTVEEGGIAVGGELAARTASEWTEIFTVKRTSPEEIKLADDNLRLKVVPQSDGSFSVMAKVKSGLVLMVR